MKNKHIQIILSTIGAAILTWFINHEIGYGPIIANGLIGVLAITFLPRDIAGIAYTASFVGMSSKGVLPHIGYAAIAGFLTGIIMEITPQIYAGIGGKGGTTAALSTIIVKFFKGLIGG